jgi:hypothetical protein
MFLFSSFQQNISVFAAVIFGKKWVTDSCLTHGRYALTGTVGGAEGAAAPPPPSLLGKQSQSGNIRFTVGQYWLIIKINGTNSVNFVGNMLSKGLIPRRAKCQKFRAKTHLCEKFLS